MSGGHPVKGCLDLTAVGCIAAAGGRIIGAVKFNHLTAVRILDYIHAGDKVGIAQAHFPARGQAEEFFGRRFHEIIAFNI